MAYRTALCNPPDVKAHHTFNVTPPMARRGYEEPDHNRNDGNQETKAKFSRQTHSTLLCFITGHAFTREYTKQFYPPHMQDQIACPCDTPLQTVEHVLTECPQYTAACHRHLTANGQPQTLLQLFANSKHVQETLRFLEEMGACAKPQERWEPE